MRYSALLGGILASALASMSYGTIAGQMHQPSTLMPYDFFKVDRLLAGGPSAAGYRGSSAQRHTGAGARGMHRAWQRRRASGRH